MMNEVLDKIILDVIKKIESHKGISRFVIERSKFEGWLKVEIIESAIKQNCLKVTPEKKLIDVTFEHKSKTYALELKTINTNYRYQNIQKKTRPITKNIEGILKDVSDLKQKDYNFKYVLFIVFPLDLNKDKKLWEYHLKKINSLIQLQSFPINFSGNYKGMLYLGEVKGNLRMV